MNLDLIKQQEDLKAERNSLIKEIDSKASAKAAALIDKSLTEYKEYFRETMI